MAGTLTIHYGLPGTGKSLFAVNDVIIPAVREHRPFFTNITGISLSGLYAVTDVHQSAIRYYPVKDINDVIRYFDDPEMCARGVFILDEMKDFIDNEKAVSWLESRINVMRKQTVDFVLIAQLPEKEYIHPHIVELADSCNVAVSRKKYGDTAHVDWYYVDGGRPRIVNKIPTNSAGKKVRKKPVEVFSCYKTSENKFYSGEEDKTYRGLMWWQTRTAKLRFLLVGLFAVVLIVFLFVGYTFYDMVWGEKETKSAEKPRVEKLHHEKEGRSQDEKSGETVQLAAAFEGLVAPKSCYSWKICTEVLCRTDIGAFPLDSVGADTGRLCDARKRCFGPCKDDTVLSGGR